jgi:hypothetical protein
VSCGLQ